MTSPNSDLFEYINRSSVSCLNASPEHPVSNLFLSAGATATGSFLCSDCDEELLITIPFREKVKIYSIEFTAPNDGRRPNHVRMFINTPHLSFSDCENATAIQEGELSWAPAGDEQKASFLTRFVKFQNIDSLSIYITSNTEDNEVTCLSGLTILGQTMGGSSVWDPSQQPQGGM